MAGNILVRGTNWVGDAIMTMPALRAIKQARPGDRLTLASKPWTAPLFKHAPYVDEIILINDKARGVKGTIELAGRIRAGHFGSAILLQNAFGAAAMAWLARIPKRVGYARDFRTFLLTDPIRYDHEDRKIHHIEYYLNLLRAAGFNAPYSIPWLQLELNERLHARAQLNGLKRPIVGINPGARFGPAKQWPRERFADLINRTVESLDGSALILGGPGEAALGDEITALSQYHGQPDRLTSLAGKTTLRESAALISELDALVTTDSGPMHMGYALRTPLVAIFGSTDPKLTGPVGYGFKVLHHPMDCSPCFKRTCETENMKCMDAITTDEVFGAVQSLLPAGKAVFFDRDGTLCHDPGYLNKWSDFKVMDDISSTTSLINKGFKLIGITNQSGIARGTVGEEFVGKVNSHFVREHGFSGFYYCPHHPDVGCACRKPEPEMLLRARAEHSVELRKSFMVGDKASDMALARAVGARGVLLGGRAGDEGEELADFRASTLAQAVQWILAQ